MAWRVRSHMPKNSKDFILVAEHIYRNRSKNKNKSADSSVDQTQQEDLKSSDKTMDKFCNLSPVECCKVLNKKLRIISNLRERNRISEQQRLVSEVKIEYGGIRKIAQLSGCRKNYVAWICSKPEFKLHKATLMKEKRKQEFMQFIEMESVSFVSPCRKYADKKFLLSTLDETYQLYEKHEEFHRNGKIAKSTMKSYRPDSVKLARQIPLNQCLCEVCENITLLIDQLIQIGIKELPRNKYDAVAKTYCEGTTTQHGTQHSFANIKCIYRNCEHCGVNIIREKIEAANESLLLTNPTVKYDQWHDVIDSNVPRIVTMKCSLREALDRFYRQLDLISDHLFRARWNRNLLTYLKKNIMPGQIVQVQDFAMNFRNFYQNEIQLAYWGGTQTTIHATVNFMLCPVTGCKEVFVVTVVHISADLQHDSFLARACQRMNTEYLASIGINMDIVIQFTDNCKAQYKSKRPFAEIARNSTPIIRCYFGEKHGKSHADALFGRLKKWMMDNIKSGHFVVRDAKEFYNCCKAEYETKDMHPCRSKHRRVVFQYVSPSDISRHYDCNVNTVKGTLKFFSVRNTSQPLELLSREIPCVCPPCIGNNGICLNNSFTDAWKLEKLEPIRGENVRKHQKRKRVETAEVQYEALQNSSDDMAEIPCVGLNNDDTVIASRETNIHENENLPESGGMNSNSDALNTEDVALASGRDKTVENIADLLCAAEKQSSEVAMSIDNLLVHRKINPCVEWQSMPLKEYWCKMVHSLAACTDFLELCELVTLVTSYGLPPLEKRVNVGYSSSRYRVDEVAEACMPVDVNNRIPIETLGDGNCLCRALSTAYFGHQKAHLEIRARIAIEAVTNRLSYMSDEYLSRGSVNQYKRQTLPEIYTMYSRYYQPGQALTRNTVESFYCTEAHSIANVGSYLGLWQLAQASNVFNIPVRSVYPNVGTIFKDFNRYFFPIASTSNDTENALHIMWTPVIPGTSPNHFVPLLTSKSK